MRWKTTVILLTATIGIGAYLSLYEIRQPSVEERERLSRQVVRLRSDEVTQLTLDLPQAKRTLTRSGATWRIWSPTSTARDTNDDDPRGATSRPPARSSTPEGAPATVLWRGPMAGTPQGIRADPARMSRLLNELEPLTATRTLSPSSDTPLDLKALGLDPPVGWMSAVVQGKPMTLRFGDTTALGGNRYLKVSDRPEVFVVSAALFDEANQPMDAFRDPMLLRLDPGDVRELAVTSSSGAFTLALDGAVWRLTTPFADLADPSEVNALLDTLARMTIARFVDDAPQAELAAMWGFDRPKVEVALRLTDAPDQPITLFVGKPLGEDQTLVYAKRSDEPSLYAITAEEADALAHDPQGLRAKKCFDLFLDRVDQFEAVRDGARWTMERKDGVWRAVGSDATLDSRRVERLINDLVDLRVSGFVEDASPDLGRYGLEPPQGSLTVWTTAHEPPQRLLVGAAIAPSADRAGAPRQSSLAGSADGSVEGRSPSTDRYGRIEGRPGVVRLPGLVTDLLAVTPETLRPSPAPAADANSPPSPPGTVPHASR